MKDSNIPDSLLSKYFSDQCDPEETESVISWIGECLNNKEIFEQQKREWELIYLDQLDFVIPDKEKVWNRIQLSINQKIKQIPTYSRFTLIRVAGIAAFFALILGFAASFFFLPDFNQNELISQKVVFMAPSGQKSQLILPDGTCVWLNSESSITYYSDFNSNNRSVKLEGEAFFDVNKSLNNSFIVNAGYVNIQVLGTKFNVKAFTADSDILISLVEGNINLLSAKNNTLLANLKPNEIGRVLKHNLACEVYPGNADADGIWRLNKLHFDNLPANEVWKKLEHWYGVKITVLNQKPKQSYRFIVKTESLTELLDLINKLTPINYHINGEEVIIKYK